MSGPLLVTGAQGFVGRWTVAEALRSGSSERVVGLGRSPVRRGFAHHVSLGPQRVLAPLPFQLEGALRGYRYHALDLRHLDGLVALLRAERPSAVVHLGSALRDEPFERLFPINVGGTIALLRAIAQSGVAVERFVLASSGSVYGAPVTLPLRETQLPAPADLYAVSKLAAENGIPLVIARIFNVVGPGLDERHACARFASQLAALACRRSNGPVLVGDLTPERDFIDVRDVARALLLLTERGVPGTAYNVASGRATRMQTVFDELASFARLQAIPTLKGYVRAVDPSRIVADISRLRQLGYEPRYTLSRSLADLYAYYAGPVARATSGDATIEDVRAIASGVPGTHG